MIPSLGYSIPDLLLILKKCKDIYDSFYHPYKKYSKCLQEFGDELDRHYKELDINASIIEWTGEQYAGLRQFYETLHECHVFLLSQKRNLQAKLDRRLLEFISFKITLVLQSAYARVEQPIAARTPLLAADTGQSPENVKLFNDFCAILNREKRLQRGNWTKESRQKKRQILEQDFKRCLHAICSSVNLPQESPLYQVTLDELSDQLPSWRRGQLINSTGGSIHQGESDVKKLEPNVIRQIPVDIQIATEELHAASYLLLGRRCIFRDEQNHPIMEHKLPANARRCYPYSPHKAYNRPLTVEFSADQDLEIMLPSSRRLQARPRYRFQKEKDYRQFQTDCRARKLLSESHAVTISCERSQGTSDVINQCVKLWHSVTGEFDTTLSFQARWTSTARNYELPLKWFNSPIPKGKEGKVVHLELVQDMSSPLVHSRYEGTVASSRISTVGSLFSKKPRSLSTSSDTGQSIRSIGTVDPRSASERNRWCDELGFLDIKFATLPEVDDFCKAFETAAALSGMPPYTPMGGHESSEVTPSTTVVNTPSDIPVGTSSPIIMHCISPVGSDGISELDRTLLEAPQISDLDFPKLELDLPAPLMMKAATGLVPGDRVLEAEDQFSEPSSIATDHSEKS